MSDTQFRINPIVAIAAGSIIIFSAVGVGVMTGVIPSSFSKPDEQQVRPAPAPAKAAAAPSAAEKRQPQKPASAPLQAREPVKTAAITCSSCGTVVSVNVVKQQGEGSGLGAVAGGVAGAVLGRQVGDGRGRTAATVIGAGAGAYAGHQVEKHVKSTQRYDVAVRMDNGSTQSFSYDAQPAFQPGSKVKVIEGKLVAN